MTTYNYNVPSSLRGQVAELFRAVGQNSMVMNMFGTISTPGAPALKEMQGQYLYSFPNTKVNQELEFTVGGGLSEYAMKMPTFWIYTPVEVKKALYDSGSNVALPSNIAQEIANDHNLIRDEMMMRSNASRLYHYPGFLTRSSTGSLASPADCCTTAGTANTGVSWVGGQATTFGFANDILTMQNDIISEVDTYGRGIVTHASDGKISGDWLLLIAPLAAQHLRKPVYNGSYYLDVSYETYIKNVLGVNILYTPFADEAGDYTGAEDATTEIELIYKPKENFFTGVVQGLGWETEWGTWLDESRTHVRNRLQEKLVGFIRPYNINGTWKKAVTVATITPWNNAS